MAAASLGTERPVAVQAATETADAYGQMQPGWATVYSSWAFLLPYPGARASGENVNAQQLRGEVTHKVTMRYPPSFTITPQHRLLYGARVFNIVSIVNLEEANLTLELHCKEIQTPAA